MCVGVGLCDRVNQCECVSEIGSGCVCVSVFRSVRERADVCECE